ncbi:hypothetical protein Scep_008442 [Stephania cephalantha]|uniref:NADH-cytochrome b5 reductase n=1 Tax=Stephania cephalantha TaxID=152367 RepID=A0AAP0KEF0_9MAGN
MAQFFRRLARASTPFSVSRAFKNDQRKSKLGGFGVQYGAIAALSGGISYYMYFSSPNMVISRFNSCGFYLNRLLIQCDQWIEFKLHEKARVSHNSELFRFTFDPSAKLGLDIASCLLTRAPMGEDAEGKKKYVIRPYTPISDPDAKGYFDLLIKVYPEGKMSPYLSSLNRGDVVEVKGPIEKLRYTPNMKKHIGMIAGGSGITPMLQIIEAVLRNPDDNTQLSLLYANISPDDILLKTKLDILEASHPNLKIFYTVDTPTNDWRGGVGYISKDVIVKGLPGPSKDTLILVCGPPGMMEHISGEKAKDWTQGELKGLLKDAGYTEDMVYKF